MTLGQFQTLVDAYGPNLARWPGPQRAQAEAWLAQTPDAAVATWILQQAHALDEMLAGSQAVPSADLHRRTVAMLSCRPTLAARSRRWLQALTAAGVLGAGAAAGASAMALIALSATVPEEGQSRLYAQSSFELPVAPPDLGVRARED